MKRHLPEQGEIEMGKIFYACVVLLECQMLIMTEDENITILVSRIGYCCLTKRQSFLFKDFMSMISFNSIYHGQDKSNKNQ